MLRNLYQHFARKKQSEYLKLVPPKLVADNAEMFLQEYKEYFTNVCSFNSLNV